MQADRDGLQAEAPGAASVPGLPEAGPAPEDPSEEALAPEELDALLAPGAEAPAAIHPGSRCSGRVVAVEEGGVLVAFGAKVEGKVPLEDFRGPDGGVRAEPGQLVEVIVERLGAPGSYAVLSHRRAREAAAWKEIEAAHAQRRPLRATVVERVRGGLRVDIGVSAFLPGSQVDLRPVRDLEAYLGQTFEVLVIECKRRRSNAVVSRSALLQEGLEQLRQETLAELKVGEPATGVVKNVTSYGVFVDLGGIDGLIKLTELSHGRVSNPTEILQPGQEVTAKVLRLDPAKDRVALSLRGMQPNPWDTVAERYPPGKRVRGRVSSVQDYGAFVELEPGVEGLIHSSEVQWSRHAKHPSKTFSPGAETEAVVLGTNPKERRVSLSFKQLTPDPWDLYGGGLEVGQVVVGTVRRIATFGAFVEIAEGIEGLVHVSDLSWDKRRRNPRELVRKGQQINTVVLHVDLANRRLALGVKQLEPDAWDAFLSQNAVGDMMPGLVQRIVRFGAFVELAPGVEGLCHNSQVPRPLSRGKPALEAGRRYQFQIVDMNESGRRIGLRCDDATPLAEEGAETA